MGKNNRSRRAAKARKRQRDDRRRRVRDEPYQGRPGGDGRFLTLEDLVVSAVHAYRLGRSGPAVGIVARICEAAPSEVASIVQRRLEDGISSAWDRGWQPADLMRFGSRKLTGVEIEMLRAGVASEAVCYEQWGAAVAPDWIAQLEEVGAVRWWGASRPWLLQVASDWSEVVWAAISVLGLVGSVPSIPVLTPPPSRWYQETGPGPELTSHLEPNVLARIRALLAKAESTSFDAEAEAFTAKAQEMMTRHRLDRSTIQRPAGLESEVVGRRLGVDPPYAEAKAMLVGGIAQANGCRTVWTKDLGFTTVFGFPEDLDGVEELFTSLLVQATAALQREGSKQDRYGRSRTTRFRRSFLLGFATRIAQRLQETADETVRTVEIETGAELVPILDERARATTEAMEAAFPSAGPMKMSVSDGEGYRTGTRVADEADLTVVALRKLQSGGG